MEAKKYTFRPSALEKTKTLLIEDASLEIDQEDRPHVSIPYKEVAMVNPKFMGSKNYPNMYQTVLKLTNGSDFIIKSHTYSGMLSMDDLAKEYTPFILNLHLAISQANPDAIFKKGYPKGTYLFYMGIFWVMLLLIGLMSIALGIGGMYLYALGGLFGTFVIYRQMNKFRIGNKPTLYTVDDVPDHLLPK